MKQMTVKGMLCNYVLIFSVQCNCFPIFSSSSTFPPIHRRKKFVVFEECLLSLFQTCHKCGQENTDITTKTIGTYLHIKQYCSVCFNVFTWNSQPFIKNQPAGNILLSASILFS